MQKLEFKSLREAAKYAHVSSVAVYRAIRNGKLHAVKKKVAARGFSKRIRWTLTSEDLDEYRRNKFSRERRKHGGENLYDLEQDRWGVVHAAKTLSAMLGKPFHTSSVYYRIRHGEIKCKKLGKHWIISKDEIVKIYEKELQRENDDRQLRFA